MTDTLAHVAATFGVPIPCGPGPVAIPAGRSDLPRLFNSAALFKGAEIGVWQGQYAEKLCQAMPRLDLLAVDPWEVYPEYREQKNDVGRMEDAYKQAKARLAPYPNAWICRKPSEEAADLVPYKSLDFVYIDANHRRPFIDRDLVAWSRRVRPGGVVAGHDYREHDDKPWIEVRAAVDEFTTRHDIRPWFLLTGDKSPSFFWVQS